jgi:5-methylcytosine-specific restriction endonuclease McrA
VTDSTELSGETKRCSKCGETKAVSEFHRNSASKDGRQCYCKVCKRASEKATRDRYRERRNASSLAWKKRNRERLENYNCAYYSATRDRRLEVARKWREENPAKVAEYRERHPEYVHGWYLRNRELVYAYKKRRDALLRGASSGEIITHAFVAARDNWRCHICGGRVTRKNWSLDHLIPVSQGGPHSLANVSLAHRRCNSKRGVSALPAQLRLIG